MDVFDLMAKITLDSSEYESGLRGASEKTSSFGDSLKSGLGTAAKVGAAAITAVGSATVAATAALAKGVASIADYGDNIDKMSQKMGMSAESYQEWDAVMQHCGTSIESMQTSMKTLANAAETGKDAFDRLGISQEQIANMSQEELFSATISALQNVEDTTERTYLAGQLLGRGATELGALLNTSAEDTQAMKDRVHELGGVMSDEAVKSAAAYKDSLQDMQTAMAGLGRGMLSDFLPSVTTVMDGLTEVFGGNGDTGVAMIADGFDQIIDDINTKLPEFISIGGQIAGTLGSSLLENLPAMMEVGSSIISEIGQAIVNGAPLLLDSAVQIITNLAGDLSENAEAIVDGAITLVTTLGHGIIDAASAAWEVITSFGSAIMSKASGLLSGGEEMVTQTINGVLEEIPSLITGATEIVESMLQFLVDEAPGLLESGSELVGNVVDGVLNNLPAISAAAVGAVDSLLDFIVANAPTLLESGLELLSNVVQGIIDNLPQLVTAAAELVANLIATIGEHLPEILETGYTILGQLIAGLIKAIPDLVVATLQINSSIVDTFLQQDWGSIGSNIISGIASGIRNGVSSIISAAQDAAQSALNAAKNFLGIRSPSRRFRDEVGVMITQGIAAGMIDRAALDALQESADIVTTSLAKMFGVDTNDSETMKAVEAWKDAWEGGLDDTLKTMEHKLFLMRKNGSGSPSAMVAMYKQMQDKVHQQAEQARALGLSEDDAYIQELQRKWWAYNDEIQDINQETISGVYEVAKAMQQAYDEAFDKIAKKQEALTNKLTGYTSLFASVTSGVTGRTYVELQDVGRQTQTIEQYGAVLDSLRERGIGDALMQQILSLGIDEGLAYGKKLLSLSDNGWSNYMTAYDKNRQVAADIAARYYQPEYDALNGVTGSDKTVDLDEEQVGLLRRIAESFQNSDQKIVFNIGDREVAEAIFDQLVLVGKERGYNILGGATA